jgi:DUF4097 and DUF4098 domain-containing protein YvlB
MKSFFVILVSLFVCSTLAFAADSGGDDTIKRTFKVRPDGNVSLDIDFGTIRIRSTDGDEVHVELERMVKGIEDEDMKAFLERHEWGIHQDGNTVYVESRFEGEEGSWGRRHGKHNSHFRLEVTILVPERFNIDFENGAGNIEISDLTGEITGRTGAGNVEIESISGYASVRSGAGNIDIREIAGQIDASTGAGNIEVYMTEQPQGDSDLSSGAGNVTVYMSGNLAVDVEARSSLGSASSDFDFKVNGKWMSKSFEGELNGGGPALVLHSGVGSVALRRN